MKEAKLKRQTTRAAQRLRMFGVVSIVPLLAARNVHAADTSSPPPAALQVASAADTNTSSADLALDAVIVTGTRELDRKARDSTAPIDVISNTTLQQTGATDLRDALETILPSLNHQAIGGDLGALTDTLTLRGLSPDQVLVLVNGKRRHTTANLYADGGPLQGSAPVDFDLIPISAIDHIEVLRDGAAAQYGSDAIAGVINVILKSADHGGTVGVGAGAYYKGDGFTSEALADGGVPLTEEGFLHFSGDYLHHDHSVRSGPDSRTGVVDNLIFGDPEVDRGTVAFNAGAPIVGGGVLEAYSFGTYAHRDAQAYENYRLPTVLPTIWPNGFSPVETLNENDYSITGGLKGEQLAGWHWDLSTTYGGDNDGFGLDDSGNPNLLAATGATPTQFDIGSFRITQWTNNLDFVRPFEAGLPKPLNVAFGVEERHETYVVGPGDPDSYYNGGSQAFQGLAPVNSGSYSRSNEAGYIDLATNLLPNWQTDVAGRFEHYSDFGNTTSGKFSTRYDFTDRFALRATASNGFRAPSLAQEYFSDVNVSPTGASGQLAANSPAAALLGALPLKAEKSTNFSVGAVLEPVDGLNVALDAYQITIKDRIVDGGTYAGDQAINALKANGITLPPGIDPADVSAVFFSNGANTRTKGFDASTGYGSDFGRWGVVNWDAALNLNQTKVTRVGLDGNGNPLLNAQGISWLETASPHNKLVLSAAWHNNGFEATVREKRYGSTSQEDTYYAGPNEFSTRVFYDSANTPKYITDLELGYRAANGLHWSVGANNLFDVYPQALPLINRYIGAAQYDTITGVGIDGGYYYTRLEYNF